MSTFPQPSQPQNTEEKKPNRVFLGGLWLNTTKDGRQYMSGYLGNNLQIQIWPNKNKPKPTSPDFSISLVESEPKDKRDTTPQNPLSSTQPLSPSDIPF